MSIGSNQSPFRKPCAGAADDCTFRGARYDHYNPLIRRLPLYTNTTKVPDFHVPPGDDIPPYPRSATEGLPSCAGGEPDCTFPLSCNQWQTPPPANAFTLEAAPNNLIDIAACHTYGWRGLAAWKNWYGRFGFQGGQCGDTPAGDSVKFRTLTLAYEHHITKVSDGPPGDGVNDGTFGGKISFTITQDKDTGIYSRTGFSLTLDPDSESPPGPADEIVPSRVLWQTWFISKANEIFSMFCINDVSAFNSWGAAAGPIDSLPDGMDPEFDGTITNTAVALSNTWTWYNETAGDPELSTKTVVASITATLSDEYTFEQVMEDAYELASPDVCGWDFTDDQLWYVNTGGTSGVLFRQDSAINQCPLVTYDALDTIEWGVSFNLPQTYFDLTGTEILIDGGFYADSNGTTILTLVQFEGNAGDPPSTMSALDGTPNAKSRNPSSFSIIAGSLPPNITLDGTTGDFGGTLSTDGTNYWALVSIELNPAFTGLIKGMPMPRAFNDPTSFYYDGGGHPEGHYDRFFDFTFENYLTCIDDDGGSHIYLGLYGGYSTDSEQIPAAATQWTNAFEASFGGIAASFIPKGASALMDSGTGIAKIQLWAETKIDWPSQNNARPCGLDRFLPDESKTGCFAGSFSGGTDNAIGVGGSFLGLPSAGDICIWPDGVYQLLTISGGIDGVWDTTRGAKICDLPTDYLTDYCAAMGLDVPDVGGGDAMDFVGTLRWFSKPGLCGRMGVTITDLGGGTLNAQTSAPCKWLLTGDAMDFLKGDNSAAQSNKTITRVDDSNFTFSGALADYATVKFFMVHGAPDYSWNDDTTKGDYIYGSWTFTDVLAGTTTASYTQLCLPFVPCCPSVMAILPYSQAWPNGLTQTFPPPGFLILDSANNSCWQGDFKQTMQELFFQTPHFKCADCFDGVYEGGVWQMDDGNCQDDGAPDIEDFYYAHFKLVEPRLAAPTKTAVPTSAPAFPSPIAYPASPNIPRDAPNSFWEGKHWPWQMYFLECSCIGLNGRFAVNYDSYGNRCD